MQPFDRLEEAVDRLLALPAEARAAALAELAQVSANLAVEAGDWLQAIERSEGFLEAPATRQKGQRIGAWSLTRPIGQGGMGEVWLAERADDTYRKQVAIKFFRVDRAGTARRLAQERQVLARLVHPGIARLLDAGNDPAAGPYLVTEFIEGRTLDRWLEETRPDRTLRLAVFRAIADAVAHAHRDLVIHRDIKPANVMVDAANRPHLLDFGIAKVLAGDGNTRDTQDLAATPHCAAPEQLRGEPAGTRTDVYALGALLYRLLSDRDPLALSGLPLAELVRRVCDETPIPPTVGTTRVDPDLDAICLCCLEKEPARRYASVDALLADLDAWDSGRPVAARRGGRVYRIAKFLRRHALAVSAAAALLVAIIGGAAATAWQAREARREADRAMAVQSFLTELFGTIDPEQHQGRPVPAEALVLAGEQRLQATPDMDPALRFDLLKLMARLRLDLGQFEARLENQQAACPIAVTLHGPDHETTLVCHVEWADSLRQMQRLDDAERILADVLARLDRRTPALPAVEALAQEVQFMIDRDQDQPDAAEKAIRRSLAIARSIEPQSGPATVKALEQLAMFLRTSGRLDESETLLNEVLEFDVAHPEARSRTEQRNTQWNQLSAWWSRDRYGDIATTLDRMKALTERDLGQSHPTWFRLQQLKANVMTRLGKVQEAIALRDATDRTEGIADWSNGRFRQMLWADQVIDLAAVGRTADAMALAERTLAWTEERALPAPPRFIASYGALYAALLANDAVAAETWHARLNDAFAALDQTAQAGHRRFRDQAFAAFAWRMGQPADAETAIDAAIAAAQPDGKPSTHAAERFRAQRAFLLVDTGRFAEAAEALADVRAKLVARFGEDHPSIAQIDAARGALPNEFRDGLDDAALARATARFEAAFGRAPDRVRLW